MAFSLKAILGLETTQFERGIGKAKKGIKGMADDGIKNILRLGAAFAGIGLVKKIISLGTAAAETASKFEAVFGPATDKLNESVQELRKTIPATTAEIQNSLATFGQMARAFGMSEEAANKFSVSMVKISGDLASFHNLESAEVFDKIAAAITGEFEPLKRLGIVINEATLKQQALEDGIWDGIGALNANQKAITVQTLVLEQMGTALGDAEKTAGSAANKIKFLKAEMTELGTEIGVTALPAVVELTKGLSWMLTQVQSGMAKIGTFAGQITVPLIDANFGLSQTIKNTKGLSAATKEATNTQNDMTVATNKVTRSLKEEAEETKKLKEQIREYYKEAKTATDIERDRFIGGKELEILKLRAQGESEAADALEGRIESMKKAIEISDKYGISLRKAANLVENINRAEAAEASELTDTGTTTATPTAATDATAPTASKSSRDPRSSFRSKFGPKQTFGEREAASGLFLAGNDPLSGRRGPEDISSGAGAGKDKAEEITDPIVKAQNATTEELKKLRTGSVST